MNLKEKKYSVGMKYSIFVLGWLLVSIASELFLKYTVLQWTHDRKVEIFPVVMGITMEIVGCILLILLFRQEFVENKMDWKKELRNLFFIYIVCQVLASLVLGTLGVALKHFGNFEIMFIRQIVDIGIAIVQACISSIIVFLISVRIRSEGRTKERSLFFIGTTGIVILTVLGSIVCERFGGVYKTGSQIVWNVMIHTMLIGWFFHIGRKI